MCEDDGNSVYCPVRVFGAGGIGSYIGMGFMHGVTDFQSFAIGLAALIGTTAGGIAVKSKMGADAP